MQISVIGCGWLGLPLAEHLIANGHKVLGSTTSQNKLEVLKKSGINPVLFKLDPMPQGENFNQLFESELIIITIPPGRKKNPPHFYEEQVKYLKYRLEKSSVKHVIFISSTSFYPNTKTSVDTSTLADFKEGSSEAIVKGESQIEKIKQQLVILRCGGLMGVDRIPGKWFSGKETTGAETKVNYIHRDDVIKIVSDMVREWPKDQKVFNAVSVDHPTRKEVHEAMAKKYGFEQPIWVEPTNIASKVVMSDFTDMELKSPLDF